MFDARAAARRDFFAIAQAATRPVDLDARDLWSIARDAAAAAPAAELAATKPPVFCDGCRDRVPAARRCGRCRHVYPAAGRNT